MALTENPATFFSTADFAVTATFGAQTAQVLLDAPDEAIGVGYIGALSREYRITYRADQLTGLTTGNAVTVDGSAYTVREAQAMEDGKVMQATLSKN